MIRKFLPGGPTHLASRAPVPVPALRGGHPAFVARLAAELRASVPPKPPAPVSADPDADMEGNTPAARARAKERARCIAIFTCEAGRRLPQLAATLAANVKMDRKTAIAALEAAAAGAGPERPGLSARMAAHRNPRLTPDAPPMTGSEATAASWAGAFAAIGVKPRS
ncbi:MAG: hypothetical protein K2X11_02590 [Acetobacteraceae bacterium]|nr:hypothetical protein [Acetobacteraceae bacterium]